MSQNYAVMIFGPQAGTQVPVGVASTGAQDLGSATRIAVKVTQSVYIRFGNEDVGAAVATDYYLDAGKDYAFDVAPFCQFFRAIRLSADSVLTWAKVQ